jgi:uncharacterized protein (TIGR02453 family)
MPAAKPEPTPFDRETMRFLRDLAANNDRPWFAANKDRYERHVAGPALEFIAALSDPLAKISRHFAAVPKRVGGSLMRVYKDTRFARDKTPFKTNIGIQLRHERGRDVHAPGFYVHVEPGRSFLGVGIWRPDAQALAAIRQEIFERPALWKSCRDRPTFRRHFELDGEQLARVPRGFAADAPHAADLRRKDFIATCKVRDTEVTNGDFTRLVAERFRTGAPFMEFICGALDLSF